MTTLYRLYNKHNRLLYVGISLRPYQRFREHRTTKPWAKVTIIKLQHFETRSQALEAERNAISSEHPKWNVQHTNNPSTYDELHTCFVCGNTFQATHHWQTKCPNPHCAPPTNERHRCGRTVQVADIDGSIILETFV